MTNHKQTFLVSVISGFQTQLLHVEENSELHKIQTNLLVFQLFVSNDIYPLPCMDMFLKPQQNHCFLKAVE